MTENAKKRLLLVEDDAITALTSKRRLEEYGYAVLHVSTGEKAVEAVKAIPGIDLILMDIDLGNGIDGAEAAAIILKDHELPLIFVSGHTGPEVVEKTEHIPSYGYVVKASGINVLDSSIKTAFKLFDAQTERKQIENTQTFLLSCGSPGTGGDFFNMLAAFLATSLGMDYVCIDRLVGDGLNARTEAIYNDGRYETNVTYALKDTPCGNAVGKTVCCFPRNIRSLFPNDAALRDLQSESYVGTTLWSHEGKPIGLIALLARKPIENPAMAETILKMVSIRAAGELERKQGEEEIKKQLAEKETILKEVHHRIKNNMNTISGLLTLQANSVKESSAIAVLQDAGYRIQSMSLLYDKLYQSPVYTELSIKEYLFNLVDEVVANFPNNSKVRIEKDLQDFVLDIKHLQPIGIIVNELLTNIMKYAFTGRDWGTIAVSAVNDGGRVLISVRDDGIGIPQNISFGNATGFGLHLVHALAQQLEGTLRIERGNGTKVVLEFIT